MNDVCVRQSTSLAPRRMRAVRARDAASLIVLRGAGPALEVLVGRRSPAARFMPGIYVFPGGAIDPSDRVGWSIESDPGSLSPRLLRAARAAIRETWEEVGVLIGRRAEPSPPPASNLSAIDNAFRERGLSAALDGLIYVGRAITPSHSARRFNTRFFLCDGDFAIGDPKASSELEDAGWHPLEQELVGGFRDVTQFMLTRAIALREGSVASPAPLFYWAKNARRIGICREGER